jgi:hypothetical protein
VPLTDVKQKKALKDSCSVWVAAKHTIDNNDLNIFNSSNIRGTAAKDDPDLGSPNAACPGGGPGLGKGGKPWSLYPNCEKQGNLLIIQDEHTDPSWPNDSAYGGCFQFTFVARSVSLVNLGLLDIDETATAKIGVTDSKQKFTSFNSPANIGDNGLWIANKTVDMAAYDDVVKMNICIPGSGAVSFVHFKACGH